MSRWKRLSPHILGLVLITLTSLSAIVQAKHLSSFHKSALVLITLVGASFLFESILAVRRRVVEYYKVYSVANATGLLSILVLDPSLNSYMYFVAGISLSFFAIKAAHLQFILHSYEVSPSNSRYQLDLNCSIKTSTTTASYNSRIIDISNTGCLVECNESHLKPGDMIYLDIHLKNREVKTSARVIRYSKNPRGYGVQFIGLDRRRYNTFDDAIKDILVDSGTIPHAA